MSSINEDGEGEESQCNPYFDETYDAFHLLGRAYCPPIVTVNCWLLDPRSLSSTKSTGYEQYTMYNSPSSLEISTYLRKQCSVLATCYSNMGSPLPFNHSHGLVFGSASAESDLEDHQDEPEIVPINTVCCTIKSIHLGVTAE